MNLQEKRKTLLLCIGVYVYVIEKSSERNSSSLIPFDILDIISWASY